MNEKNKKVGIATFCSTIDNYGQILQNFALQYVLKKKGFQPITILYNNVELSIFQYYKYKLLSILRLRKVYDPRGFCAFRKKYIKKTKPYFGIKSLFRKKNADLYITGSDQVWSMSVNDVNNGYYYLAFVKDNIPKISYAASFGRDVIPNNQKETIKKFLSRFSAISVRELSGITICENLGLKAEHVLDPTMLLSGEVYRSIFKLSALHTNKYVYVYHLNINSKNDIYWDTLRNVIDKYKIIGTVSSGRTPAIELLPDIEYVYPNPIKWLEYISNAELVITTSFHGMVYAILFHIPFLVFPLRGEHSNSNSRIVDLLKAVNLGCRLITAPNCIADVISQDIDWIDVEQRLDVFRNKSLTFLNSNL